MKLQRVISWALVLVFAFAAMGISGPVLAQGDGEGEEEALEMGTVTGEITITDDEIVVADEDLGDITIAPAGAFNPSTVEDGSVVTITGYWLNETTMQALLLEMDDAEDADDDVEDGEDDADDEDGDEDGDEDADDEDEDDADDEDGTCGENEHPVLMAAAESFSELTTYDELVELHCAGMGVGNIIKMLQVATLKEMTFDDAQAAFEESGNWGQFKKDMEIHPSELAPGQLKKKQAEDAEAAGEAVDAPGNSGNAPGNSGNAPGQNKDKKDKPDKGKGKGKGN